LITYERFGVWQRDTSNEVHDRVRAARVCFLEP
jgi:hypothetical protein